MPRRYPRGLVGGSPYEGAVNDAPADSPAEPAFRPIEIRQVQRREMVGEWPQYTEISLAVLAEDENVQINNKGRIVFRFDNGYAIYQLYPHQVGYSNSLKLELVRAR